MSNERYNLVLPKELYDELYARAEAHDVSVAELLRKFIRLGLLVLDAEADPSATFILRRDGIERELILL